MRVSDVSQLVRENLFFKVIGVRVAEVFEVDHETAALHADDFIDAGESDNLDLVPEARLSVRVHGSMMKQFQ